MTVKQGFLKPIYFYFVLVVGLLSGGLGIFKDWAIMYYPTLLSEKTVSWIFVRIAMAVAFVILWLNERKKVEAQNLLLGEPSLTLHIEQVITAHCIQTSTLDKSSVGIRLTASVSNKGTPSIAEAWRLIIKASGIKPITQVAAYVGPETRINMSGIHQGLSFQGDSDSLYERAFNSVIERGAKRRGTLLFLVEGISLEQLRQVGTVITLICRDIEEREVSTSHTMRNANEPFMYMPGTKAPVQQRES